MYSMHPSGIKAKGSSNCSRGVNCFGVLQPQPGVGERGCEGGSRGKGINKEKG